MPVMILQDQKMQRGITGMNGLKNIIATAAYYFVFSFSFFGYGYFAMNSFKTSFEPGLAA